jgi:hypothetical protein
MLNAEEREISIYKTDDEDEFTIYTTSPTWMRRIEKQGYIAYDQDTMDGELCSKCYKVPQKFLKFTKERQYTEEQRQEMSERAKRNLAKKSSTVIEELEEVDS